MSAYAWWCTQRTKSIEPSVESLQLLKQSNLLERKVFDIWKVSEVFVSCSYWKKLLKEEKS